MMSENLESFSLTHDETLRVITQYLVDLSGPTALGIEICVRSGDFLSACTHSINPLQYENPDDYRAAYLATQFLSKFSATDNSRKQLRESRAKAKFFRCEDDLKGVLRRLRLVESGETDVDALLRRAREKIHQILGPVKDVFKIDQCSFGPGSSSSVPRSEAHPSRKFIACDVTASCVPFVSWFFTDAKMTRPLVNLVEHSRICFVPKNFKIDRIIAIEPDWNIFFQKGFGAAIRGCLRRAGLDLNHGAEKHQRLAFQASLSGQLATIDLSSASDCLSTALVRFMLPDDWFACLNSTRTNAMLIDGVPVPLLKFSSMGNGFTFELESLIFYALAFAARERSGTRGEVSTFGDDIIVPVGAVSLLVAALTSCGFSINTEKSFAEGYFRESCGAHYFKGMDVKPIYLKECLFHDSERFKLCNAIRNLALRSFHTDVFDSSLRRVYNCCRHNIRRVFYIPAGYGDGGLVSRFDEIPTASALRRKNRPVRRHPNCIEGFKVRCLLPIAFKGENESYGMLIHKLRGTALKRRSSWLHSCLPIFKCSREDLALADVRPETGNGFMVSGVNRYRVGHMHVERWTDPE